MSSGQGWLSHGRTATSAFPDVSFTRKERHFRADKPHQTLLAWKRPDLCIEIISPSEEAGRTSARKMREYFHTGAQFVWHIFPERQQVTVFTSPTETETYGPEDTLTVGDILPGFSCRVSDLFLME